MLVIEFGYRTVVLFPSQLPQTGFLQTKMASAFKFQEMAFKAFLAFLVPSQLITPTLQHFNHQQDGNVTS